MLIFSSRKKLLEFFQVFWWEEKKTKNKQKQFRERIIESIPAESEWEEVNTLIMAQ